MVKALVRYYALQNVYHSALNFHMLLILLFILLFIYFFKKILTPLLIYNQYMTTCMYLRYTI